ncbi:hypothetical protein ACQZV8_15825 [Magnetococcales bacterium HHB-1]
MRFIGESTCRDAWISGASWKIQARVVLLVLIGGWGLLFSSLAEAQSQFEDITSLQRRAKMARQEAQKLRQRAEALSNNMASLERQALESEKKSFTLEQRRSEAWKTLKEKFNQVWGNPRLTVEGELRGYAQAFDALKSHEARYSQVLKEISEGRLRAEQMQNKSLEAQRQASLLDEQVRQAQLQLINRIIRKPIVVESRGEQECNFDKPINVCRKQALKKARENALAAWKRRIVSMLPGSPGGQNQEYIINQASGEVKNHKIIGDGWTGRAKYYYQIQATVQGLGGEYRGGNPSPPVRRPSPPITTQHNGGRLLVETDPPGALVRILNIREPYRDNIYLRQGRYQISVSKSGFKTKTKWVKISRSDVEEFIELKPEQPVWKSDTSPPIYDPTPPTPVPGDSQQRRLTVDVVPRDSRVRILNIVPPYRAGMLLKPGRYHIEVTRKGYRKVRRWVELTDFDLIVPVVLMPRSRSGTINFP